MSSANNRFLRATLPNGTVIHRTDGVLVEHGQIQAGHIDSIELREGYYTVNVNVMVGEYNKTTPSKPDVEYVSGFFHVSTPQEVKGKRFMLVSDGEEAEIALREHHTWAATQRGPMSDERTLNKEPQTPKPDVTVDNPRTPLGDAKSVFDVRDKDQDGVVTKEEKKEYKKNQ